MFYEQLDKACKANKTTVTALARNLKMSTGNVTRWKNGGMPSVEVLLQLSDTLNVSTDYLLTGKEYEPKPKLKLIENEKENERMDKKESSRELIGIIENSGYKEAVENINKSIKNLSTALKEGMMKLNEQLSDMSKPEHEDFYEKAKAIMSDMGKAIRLIDEFEVSHGEIATMPIHEIVDFGEDVDAAEKGLADMHKRKETLSSFEKNLLEMLQPFDTGTKKREFLLEVSRIADKLLQEHKEKTAN